MSNRSGTSGTSQVKMKRQLLNRNDQGVPALRVDMSLVYIHEFVGFRYLFCQPVDEKIKTWTPRRFPAKGNPNMEKAMFDWPMVLQYDVKAKYRLICRKHKVFSHERSLNQPKATRLYPFDKPIKSLYSRLPITRTSR